MGLDTTGAEIQNLDLEIGKEPTMAPSELTNSFEKFNEPLAEEFKKILEKYIGTDFIQAGEQAGFKFYQPLKEYQKSMDVTFVGVFQDKTILISAKKPTDEEKEEHFVSSVSIRFAPLQDWTNRLEWADKQGDLENGRKLQDPVVIRSPLFETDPTSETQRFLGAVQELKNSLDTKRIHLIGFLDNDRRVRIEKEEYRFKLHKELEISRSKNI